MTEAKAKKIIEETNTLLVKSKSVLKFEVLEINSSYTQIGISFKNFISDEILRELKKRFKASFILIFDTANLYITILK